MRKRGQIASPEEDSAPHTPLLPSLPSLMPSACSTPELPPGDLLTAGEKESQPKNAHTPAIPNPLHIPVHPDSTAVSDSDNSSCSDIASTLPRFYCAMSIKTPAECLHTEPKHILILTGGEISPIVLRLWEMACEDFFTANRKLEAADYVGAVLPGLKDMRFHDWITSHCARLSTLAFSDFMKLLCKEFLPEGWEDKHHTQICNSRLKSSNSFTSWLNNVCHINFALTAQTVISTMTPYIFSLKVSLTLTYAPVQRTEMSKTS